ncbi:MAG: hypothetical protein WKF47_00815 [Geodermatophilaceae bacterium]
MSSSLLDRDGLRERIAAELAAFLAERAAELAEISVELDPVATTIRSFVLNGGSGCARRSDTGAGVGPVGRPRRTPPSSER